MYQSPKTGSKIIIVGGGCFGLSTALALSSDTNKKYDIYVFDKSFIPVPDAASTDISKAVRIDYGSNKLYMNLAVDAIETWKQWNIERENENLEPVYHNTGILAFSSHGQYSNSDKDTLKYLREAGYNDSIEEFSSDQIKEKYPFFEHAVDSGYNIAYLNKIGGWCNSSEAIMHIYHKCINNGVKFVLGKESGCFKNLITPVDDPKSVTGIITLDGKRHECDRVILATGSWTPSIIDMHKKVIATGQIIVQFKLSDRDADIMKKLPVWSGDVSRTGFYGFPVNKDNILKIGKHSIGYLNPRESDHVSVPRTQVSNVGDTIPISALNNFREFLKDFFPITEPLDVFYSRVCWYSDSIDGDFLICPHPDYKNLIVATGDSGHAMKFLPNIGDKIKDVIEAKDTEYTRAWSWRSEKPQDSFYDRPLLVDEENTKINRMATLEELKSKMN